jgi:hypothetical protein
MPGGYRQREDWPRPSGYMHIEPASVVTGPLPTNSEMQIAIHPYGYLRELRIVFADAIPNMDALHPLRFVFRPLGDAALCRFTVTQYCEGVTDRA